MMPSRTNLSAGIPSSKVKYSKLSSTDDGYIDLQFKKSPPKIPYKAIALAVVLFMIGTFLIIIGALLLAGYISKGVSASDTPGTALGDTRDSKQPQVTPGEGYIQNWERFVWERPGRAAGVQSPSLGGFRTRGCGTPGPGFGVTLAWLDLMTLKVSSSLKDPGMGLSVELQSHRE
uniref:Transmembrane protein 230 n=1 Tax=Serinus canaria TaxID=9135 RepID=A0A8C9NTT0_SERCA